MLMWGDKRTSYLIHSGSNDARVTLTISPMWRRNVQMEDQKECLAVGQLLTTTTGCDEKTDDIL